MEEEEEASLEKREKPAESIYVESLAPMTSFSVIRRIDGLRGEETVKRGVAEKILYSPVYAILAFSTLSRIYI